LQDHPAWRVSALCACYVCVICVYVCVSAVCRLFCVWLMGGDADMTC
jgi:hypothetical protein